MNYIGIIIGISVFLLIGAFHPIVVKAEYFFGTRCWWIFALVGTVSLITSLFVANVIGSTILGALAFSCYWSILELFEQEERVKRGWFPANPKKKHDRLVQ